MRLGLQKWSAAKTFYDSLTLADGDEIERAAERNHQISSDFPNYVKFWKFHICPATNRPQAITWRKDTADIVSTVGQRSHAVLSDLNNGLDFFRMVRVGDLGPNERNVETTLLYVGNALQKFTELGFAICATNPDHFRGMNTLAIDLGVSINLFPDWQSCWERDRTVASNYRNYLTHQGRMFRVHRGGDILILSRAAFRSRTAYTWTQAGRAYDADPSQWVTLQSACGDVIQDTIAFLDLGYERIRQHLDPHLTSPAYQHLWGWRDSIAPVAASAARVVPVNTVTPRPSLGVYASLTATSSSKMDERTPLGLGNEPDPSGTRIV